jgi:Zn-dependent protease
MHPTQSAPTYYKLDNRGLSFADCWYLTKSPMFLFLAGAKLFRIPLEFNTYLPGPRRLTEQMAREEDLPEEVMRELQPKRAELEALGYKWPIYHFLREELLPSSTHGLAMVSPDGQTIAKIICVLQTHGLQKVKNVVTAFVSPLASGRFLATGSRAVKGFAPDPRVIVRKIKGKDLASIRTSHEKHLRDLRGDSVKPVRSFEEFIALTDEYENMHMHTKIAQGVYREVPPEEVELVRRSRIHREAPAPTDTTSAAQIEEGATAAAPPRMISEGAARVQLEIARQQNPKESWKANAWLLALTAVLFAFSFKGQMNWTSLGVLMIVLLIHELGHYAAMKAFGYRNVRMFFLPFFGAAVSGKKFGVAAWRKALVSLMGPVPGIIVGAALLLQSGPETNRVVAQLAIMFLVLNLFNLAPILPLDGGWFWHTILFSRHRWADVVFRVSTSVVLMLVSVLVFHSVLLAVVGFFMLIAVPQVYHSGKIATDLRRENVLAGIEDLQEVPPQFTETVLDRFRAAMPKKNLHTKLAAQVVLDIYERVTSKPAGLVQSVLLAIIYVGAVLLGAGVILIPFIARISNLGIDL